MDIRCPQCSTLYEFDATRIRGRSVNFKCSQCSAVFRVEGPSADAGATNARQGANRWMVRKTATGDVLYFAGMQTLQKWIIDRKVGRKDEISKTGKKWKALGDIGELSSFFQVAESIERVQPGAQPLSPEAGRTAVPIGGAAQPSHEHPTPERPMPRPRPQPQAQPPQPRQPTPPQPRPAPRPTPQPQAQPPQQAPQPQQPRPAPDNARRPSPQHHSAPGPPAGASAANRGAAPGKPLETGPWGKVQPVMETGGWSIGQDGQATAPPVAERRGADLSSEFLGNDEFDVPRQKSAAGPILVVVIIALLLGGGAYIYFVQPELIGLSSAGGEAQANAPVADDGETPRATPEVAEATPDAGDSLADSPDAQGAEEPPAEEAAAEKDDARPAARARGEDDEARKRRRRTDDDAPMAGGYDGLMSRGYRYLKSGRGDKALQAFQAAASQRPTNSEAHGGMGWSYLAQGNPRGAIGAFKKALDLNSRYGDAYIGLGQAYRSTGQKAQAMQAYERYLSLYPGGPKASIAKHHAERLRDELGPPPGAQGQPGGQPPGGSPPAGNSPSPAGQPPAGQPPTGAAPANGSGGGAVIVQPGAP